MSVLDLEPHLFKKATSDLQIVVIDSFYDAANQDDALKWLGELFRFKVNSYRKSYPYGIMPFGGTDLIGTNWVLCRKEIEGLKPIMGFKTIESKRTDTFRMEFPAFGMVASPGQEAHRKAIQYELDRVADSKHGLGFLGSWTVDPSLRRDVTMLKLCRKVSSALYSHWVNLFDIQAAVTFAILKFHVEKFHAYMGMTRLKQPNGDALSDITPHVTFGEPTCVSILYRENHSQASAQDRLDLADLWDNRIVIASEHSPLFNLEPARRVA